MRTIKSELSIPVDDSLVFGNLNLVENEKGFINMGRVKNKG